MSESLIFNFSTTQDACFDRHRTEIYSKTPVFKEDTGEYQDDVKFFIF